MFMILTHHLTVHNSYGCTLMAADLVRFLIQFFLESGGIVGITVFFTISAWFFCECNQMARGRFLRVWSLEKEVLPYSLLLATICLAVGLTGPRLAVRSPLPLILGIWWYPTAYATFFHFLPITAKGLREIERTYHLVLCAILLVLYGVLSLLPDAQMVGKVYGFAYLLVLISAYRRYLEDSHPLAPG